MPMITKKNMICPICWRPVRARHDPSIPAIDGDRRTDPWVFVDHTEATDVGEFEPSNLCPASGKNQYMARTIADSQSEAQLD